MITSTETFYTDDLRDIHAIEIYVTEAFEAYFYSMNGCKHEFTLKANTKEEMEEAIDKFRIFIRDIGFKT